MDERRRQQAHRCPVCGRTIARGRERVRAWPGAYAHPDCVSYSGIRARRAAASHRVYRKFTRT